MKFAHPQIDTVFQWDQGIIPTIVIENQHFFRTFLRDVVSALNGDASPAVLSVKNKPVNMSQYAEMIVDFVNLKINQKHLLAKICSAMERIAVDSDHYIETQSLLAEIERYVAEWGFSFPCDVIGTKISVSALLKAVGIELRDDYSGEIGELERIIDYMELVREFDRDKMFLMVNIRSYYSDEMMDRFLQTAIANEHKLILLESAARPMLKRERRTTIDRDLCEF